MHRATPALTLVLAAWLVAGGPVAAHAAASHAANRPAGEEQVVLLLQRWHDQIAPLVPDAERQQVETFAAGYPLEAPAGVAPVDFEVKEGEHGLSATPRVNRRDWAYATQGAMYTLRGALGQGQRASLDAGFWAFLEAALLRPAEVEHLSNVGFHLNLRGAFDDAVVVLLHARSLEDAHVAVYNNLARAYAGLGDWNAAIAEGEWSVSLRPREAIYYERLATYVQASGRPEMAALVRAQGQAVALSGVAMGGLDPVGAAPSPSEQGRRVLELINMHAAALDQARVEIGAPFAVQLMAAVNTATQRMQESLQKEAECQQDVASGNPPDLPAAVCRACAMPATQERYGIDQDLYGALTSIATQFSAEFLPRVADSVRDANQLVQSSGLGEEEQQYLLGEVRHRIYDRGYGAANGLLDEVNAYWHAEQEDFQGYITDLTEVCGRTSAFDPSQLPHGPNWWEPMAPLPPLFVNLFVLSIETQSSGQIKLSVGQGAQLKLEFNIETYQFGVGGGLGFSFGAGAGAVAQPLKSEVSLVYRSPHFAAADPRFPPPEPGFAGGVEVKVNPISGLPIGGPAGVPPRPSLKVLSFEN